MQKNILKNLKKIVRRFRSFIDSEIRDWESVEKILLAKVIMASESWRKNEIKLNLSKKEFRVYSQWGDDGIIQYLIHILNLKADSFIEFGVADFYESNTHFLMVNNNWRGFVIDGSDDNINKLKNSQIYWRYDLHAVSSFVTADNVNTLLASSGFENIGFLHIDLDGNDYWILKELDLTKLNPDILVLEYNALFGCERAITIPYNFSFYRMNGHYSGQYFGASLPALHKLALEKGYYFIGCNSAGNNAYFLRSEYKEKLPEISLYEGFVDARFRDSRDKNGHLNFLTRDEARKIIEGLAVINVDTDQEEAL